MMKNSSVFWHRGGLLGGNCCYQAMALRTPVNESNGDVSRVTCGTDLLHILQQVTHAYTSGPMRNQLETWEGEFGVAYTDRNVVDPTARIEAFRTMVDGLDIARLLEVGCNRGHNLV